MLRRAAAEPATLAIGLDADAASMAELSRRAARPAAKGGLPNAVFVLVAAEALPTEVAGLADLVTVQFPWGSLLRGCLGHDPRVAACLAGLLKPGATLEALLAPAPRDGLVGLPTELGSVAEAAAATFGACGLELVEGREATEAELRASGSTWAKRLLAASRSAARADRRVTLVRLRSSSR